jgi:hypothetical protein
LGGDVGGVAAADGGEGDGVVEAEEHGGEGRGGRSRRVGRGLA